MKKILIRLGINAIALYAAVALLDGRGINPQTDNWISFIWLALIFGLVNAIIKPMLVVMSCPLLILTLGLGTLIINTLMFMMAGWIGTQFQIGFTVDSFWAGFLGAIIVSVISFILTGLFKDDLKNRSKK
ncbi:MAG TPA: phage holin family protein [Anaerolineaceae bacterium]|nr:phage holin family protein [Anaerolineaceae bacterium]